jgi:hypothetical protein
MVTLEPGIRPIRSNISDSGPPENYSSHLVYLGGPDRNVVTASLFRRLRLPVRQVADRKEQAGQFFEVDGDAGTTQHHPLLEKTGTGKFYWRT